MGSPSSVHKVLESEVGRGVRHDSHKSLDDIIPMIYDRLCSAARRSLSREVASHELQAEALVNEAYVRLARSRTVWRSPEHVYCVARRMLRRILIDRARRRACAKRGKNPTVLAFDEALSVPEKADPRVSGLDDALDALGKSRPRQRRVIDLLYFHGFSQRECAEILGVARNTVQKDLDRARHWLRSSLCG